MKIRKSLVWGLCILSIIYFGPILMGGYSYSKESAIRHSFPNQNGEVVLEKEFNGKKVIVWDTGNQRYVKLVDKTWGIFYRVNNVAPIEASESQDQMMTTWSAQLTDERRYDTIFAVEIIQPEIKKVILSNEGPDMNLSTLEEIKEQSAVYVEIDVINGFAVHYMNLSTKDAGNFMFRGLNEQGKIVTVEW